MSQDFRLSEAGFYVKVTIAATPYANMHNTTALERHFFQNLVLRLERSYNRRPESKSDNHCDREAALANRIHQRGSRFEELYSSCHQHHLRSLETVADPVWKSLKGLKNLLEPE